MGCAPLCVSDRDVKQDIVPADEQRVLEHVASMPFSTYGDESLHLGSIAEDPIDAHGASLASIKALYRLVNQQDARLQKLEAENQRLRARVEGATTCHP